MTSIVFPVCIQCKEKERNKFSNFCSQKCADIWMEEQRLIALHFNLDEILKLMSN